MKISFITTTPSININNWSGTEYYIAKTLEANNEVDYVTDIKMNITPKVRLKKLLCGRHKPYLLNRNIDIAKDYARQAASRIKCSSDIIFSPSTIPIAYLKTEKPKVFYTDATFASMLNYYDEMTNISSKSIQEGLALEQEAILSSRLAFYASDWAAQSAIKDYGADPNKIKVVPFGANIDNHLSLSQIESIISRKQSGVCKILFIGVDWVRKGGDIVVEAVKKLNAMGMPTELHLVGIDNPPIDAKDTYIINHGFINKASKDGTKQIEALIADSHFLFVPSRMEAYGIVFCEAMALGVPCISTNTGGISTIVRNEVNGIILDLEAEAEDYAKSIYELFNNRSDYNEIALAAYNDYSERLSWDVAFKTINKYLKEI